MLAYIPGFHQTAFQKWKSMDFAGGSVVKTLSFQCRGTGLIPGPGTKIPHAEQHRQKKKTTLKKFTSTLLGFSVLAKGTEETSQGLCDK